MIINLTTIIYLGIAIGTIVMLLTSILSLSGGKVVDKHPNAVSGLPSWSSPIPATRIFTASAWLMYVVGVVVILMYGDTFTRVIALAVIVAAVMTELTTAIMCGAVVSAMNKKVKVS
jgi:hypothetical protein